MIPLKLKIVYSAFVAVLVPAYLWEYGPANFLWFSNIALIGGLVAAWLENGRLASMMAVSVTLFELGWIIAFTASLVCGSEVLFGLVGYMFDEEIPLFVRCLSLYHIPLPFLLIWMVWRLGYDHGAWRLWLPLGWAILFVTFLVTSPERNVNVVYGLGEVQTWMPAWLWLGLVMVVFSAVWWITHQLIERFIAGVGRAA